MYRRDYPCRCGKSTYTEIVEMDDWNRRREHRIMNCPECAEQERIAKAEQKREEAEDKARLQELDADLKELDAEIKTYFAEHYMEEWLTYFSSARNKKETWTLAKKTGVESDSLSSFYKWNKGFSMEEYIRGLARYNKMQKIMEALNIDDRDFKSKVEEAMELRKSMTVVIGFY